MFKKQQKDKRFIFNDKRIAWREIEDGAIFFLDKEKKKFYEVNKSASLIWKKISEETQPTGIVNAVQRKYANIGKKVIERDVTNFIDDLVSKDIIIER